MMVFLQRMKQLHLVIVFFTVIFLVQGCGTIDVYEKTTAFSDQQWPSSVKPSFSFTIKDTSSAYNIYAVIRHTDAYHYNNIWMNITTIAPADTAQSQQINIKLADNSKGWLGSSIDDVIEQRIKINHYPIKLHAGNYQFVLQQIMREDPLANVLNAGIRVEKAVQ
jgi:gliding motility-associated lipoprotein GldH